MRGSPQGYTYAYASTPADIAFGGPGYEGVAHAFCAANDYWRLSHQKAGFAVEVEVGLPEQPVLRC